MQSYKLITDPPNNFGKKLRKNYLAAFWWLRGGCICRHINAKNSVMFMYVRACACVCKKCAQKKFEKSGEKIWLIGINVVTLHTKTNYKLKTYNYGNQDKTRK